MEANQYGTPVEQARHRQGWRTAQKGDVRCDGCRHSEGSDRTWRCMYGQGGGWATKPNATCDIAVLIPQPIPMGMRDFLVRGDMGPNWWAALNDAGEATLRSALSRLPADYHAQRHAIAEKLGELAQAQAEQAVASATRDLAANLIDIDEDHMTPNDDLPTVGEMIQATEPVEDKALPALKQAGAEVVPYDQRRIINECRFYMSQSAEAMLEAGKRLIEIKEHEQHGDFMRILEVDLNLEPRTAQRMMKAAIKFNGPQLAGPKATALSLLGKTKMFELMTEDDDDLAQLAEGGTLAGKTLDEIDRMTSRELKAALRKKDADHKQQLDEAKADLEATRKRIAKKDERINELEDQLERKAKDAPDPLAEASKYADDLHHEAERCFAAVFMTMRQRALAVLDAHQGQYQAHGRMLVAQALGRVASGVRMLSEDLDIMPDSGTDTTTGFAPGDDDSELWAEVTKATGVEFGPKKD